MRIIGSFLAAKVIGRVTPGIIIGVVVRIFGPEASHRSPGFQQGAIHRKMRITDQAFLFGLIPDGAEETDAICVLSSRSRFLENTE
jgi:hypothetical protein